MQSETVPSPSLLQLHLHVTTLFLGHEKKNCFGYCIGILSTVQRGKCNRLDYIFILIKSAIGFH